MPRPKPPGPTVDPIGRAVSKVPWSPEVVAQSLEILVVMLAEGRLFWLKPIHAPSLRVGLPRKTQPNDFVIEVIDSYPLLPRVVHSTSWRYDQGDVVLTYIVVIDPHDDLPPGSLEPREVERSEVARGDSMAPPRSITVAAVLEHAIRHLSWLVKDDAAIAAALADWSGVLETYLPEPFRALA